MKKKKKELEKWASAQIDDYFLEEIYLYSSLSTKKVCQCLVSGKKTYLHPYHFFSAAHMFFFLSFFHLWRGHAHPT